MAERTHPIALDVEHTLEAFEAASASFASLAAVARSLPDAADAGLTIPDDLSDLVRCEAIGDADAGAKFHGLNIQPSARHLALVTAATEHGRAHVSRTVLGWPVLSLGATPAPTAEAA